MMLAPFQETFHAIESTLAEYEQNVSRWLALLYKLAANSRLSIQETFILSLMVDNLADVQRAASDARRALRRYFEFDRAEQRGDRIGHF